VFRYGYLFFFVALHSLLIFGFFLEWLRDRRAVKSASGKKQDIRVSVIIPIQNEGQRMEGLLKSLLAQDYPEENISGGQMSVEIIFVDDCSSDESPAMLAKFVKDAAERGWNNCRVITLAENPGPNRKQHALSVGIAEAKGNWFLFTDGDCETPPGWIRAMACRMSEENIGAVIGPVFKKKQGKGFFFLYQCFDHAVRYNYLAGSIGLGAAGGSFGNNLIVSRAALDSVGGYDAVPPSPTEDAALISLIRSQGKYRIRAIALPDAAVETAAEKTWRGFINQTPRWNNGGAFSPDPATRINYNFLLLIIAAGIFALPFLPFFPGLWPLPFAVLIGMIENTAAIFGLFRVKLPQGGPLNFGYALSLFFTPVYSTLMLIMGYCGIKVTWKGKNVARQQFYI
jgi:cellulose synthase/poly-beta-1,6-N-acetylglucosamine synthase-like glycosyltransferase